MKNLVVMIPCYNEEKSIGTVLSKLPKEEIAHNGYRLTALVIDNNSQDNTAKVAVKFGAVVIREPQKGKGNAIRTGFQSLPSDTDYVVMLDGDDTYNAKEILRMVEPLHNDFCEVVIGSRLGGKMDTGAMRKFNRLGNWFYTHIVRLFFKVNVTDVLTGYFAWKKNVVDELLPHLKSSGFAIEMEMITKMAKLNYDIYSVPISYHPRTDDSNLHPIFDGIRILRMFVSSLFWQPRDIQGKKETA